MSKRRLEEVTEAYWAVSSAVRNPDAAKMACGDAFTELNKGDRLRPEEWRLTELIHTVRFDIIEGNTEWREKTVQDSASILPMRR